MATNPMHGMTTREEEAIGVLARTSSLTDWGALADGLGCVDRRHSRGCDRKGGGDQGGNNGGQTGYADARTHGSEGRQTKAIAVRRKVHLLVF